MEVRKRRLNDKAKRTGPSLDCRLFLVKRASCAPWAKPSAVLMTPAATPLTMAIWSGSAALSFQVRLLLMPQQMQAAVMSGPPRLTVISAPSAGQDSTSAPPCMAVALANTRRSTFSRKKIQEIAMVARLSVLRRSEPAPPDTDVSPAISSAGPRTPPNRTIKPREIVPAQRRLCGSARKPGA